MKQEEDNEENPNKLIDKQSILDLFNRKADEKAKTAYERKTAQENELFELNNGQKTSVANEKIKLQKIMEQKPQDHDPKFTLFFPALGKLDNWSEEEIKAYHKPPIAAKIINAVIYDRFPKEVILHIHAKNPYIKWCTRAFKNYLFLGEDGILLLEKFIDDAVTLMQQSTSVYDFRVKHAIAFGSGFQPVLFNQYYESL